MPPLITAADAGRVGCVGYCMSGPFSIWVAAEFPEQVKAAASVLRRSPSRRCRDSPHRRLGEVEGELYVGCAEHDDYVPLEMVDRFEAAMQASQRPGRLERYWGTHHGFAFDDRPAYDAGGRCPSLGRLLDLFDRNLHR